MQGLHIADPPGVALRRVAHHMLRSSRTTATICIARMLLGILFVTMVLEMAPGMALDIATGVGMVRDIGVSR